MENTEISVIHPSHYAGFWRRFIAACIDVFLYIPFYHLINNLHSPWWVREILFDSFALVTYAMFFASKMQGSPGMYLLKFHICNIQGKRLSLGHAIVWGIAGLIGWIICCGGMIYLDINFDLRAVLDLLQSCQDMNITLDECTKEIESVIKIPFDFYKQMLYGALGMAVFLFTTWALSIGLSKDKAGFQNTVCKTRFIKGRPPKAGERDVL